MDDLKLSVFDNPAMLNEKLGKIQSRLKTEQDNLYAQESQVLNNIVRRISFLLPREEFSGKHGILIYVFEHKNKDREVFISPEIYLVEGQNMIVYEVFKPKKYYEVSPNPIYESYNGKFFCEIPLSNTLKYASLETIIEYLNEYINIHGEFDDYELLRKRQEYLEQFKA